MPDITIPVQQVSRSGLTPSYSAGLTQTDTFFVSNDGAVVLHLLKTGAGDCTVTIETPQTHLGLAIADLVLTVPATTGNRFVGPFPPGTFNNESGQLKITFSNTTGLSVLALHP